MIYFLWAQTEKGVIGVNNHMPWKISAEMAHFKKKTWNQAVLMGSKTFESLKQTPLPNRINYVLTSSKRYDHLQSENLIILHDLKVLPKIKTDLYIIGGANVFSQLVDQTDGLIKSIIKEDYPGDVYMIPIDYTKFELVNRQEYAEFIVEEYHRKDLKNEKN